MKTIVKLCLVVMALFGVGTLHAAEADVEQLNEKVNLKVNKISELGLLPTSTEIEVITGDIVYEEIKNTELTLEQAVEKYELTPTLERYIQIKKVQDDLAETNKSAGGGREPPQPQP